jgi:hypothetical protein
MKILVATNQTQGKRKNDFCHAEEDEIVKFSSECDGEAVDGNCGCHRSMSGCTSGKATTTMRVEDRNMHVEEYIEIIRQSYKTGGWYDLMGIKDAEASIMQDVKDLLKVAKDFPAGTIVEKRGNTIQERASDQRVKHANRRI